jgi:hypothetical protein
MNKIDQALRSLGVATHPATKQFREWLGRRYPRWSFRSEFCEAVPLRWTLVERNDFLLCYLAAEENVIEIAEKARRSNLLPIGATMDGGYLVIDTINHSGVVIGKILAEHVLSEGRDTFNPNHLYTFDLPYDQWLLRIREHPEDSRFL